MKINMDKIITINGVFMATQNDFTEHVENTNIHIMEEERVVCLRNPSMPWEE